MGQIYSQMENEINNIIQGQIIFSNLQLFQFVFYNVKRIHKFKPLTKIINQLGHIS